MQQHRRCAEEPLNKTFFPEMWLNRTIEGSDNAHSCFPCGRADVWCRCWEADGNADPWPEESCDTQRGCWEDRWVRRWENRGVKLYLFWFPRAADRAVIHCLSVKCFRKAATPSTQILNSLQTGFWPLAKTSASKEWKSVFSQMWKKHASSSDCSMAFTETQMWGLKESLGKQKLYVGYALRGIR